MKMMSVVLLAVELRLELYLKRSQISHILRISAAAPPEISGTSRMQELTVALGQEVEFQCRVSGRPAPRVEWSRDGE